MTAAPGQPRRRGAHARGRPPPTTARDHPAAPTVPLTRLSAGRLLRRRGRDGAGEGPGAGSVDGGGSGAGGGGGGGGGGAVAVPEASFDAGPTLPAASSAVTR